MDFMNKQLLEQMALLMLEQSGGDALYLLAKKNGGVVIRIQKTPEAIERVQDIDAD